MERLEKTAVLENEIEARALAERLGDLGIPHLLVSYQDSILDGVFQVAAGWGHVEAPADRKEEVLATLEELRGEKH